MVAEVNLGGYREIGDGGCLIVVSGKVEISCSACMFTQADIKCDTTFDDPPARSVVEQTCQEAVESDQLSLPVKPHVPARRGLLPKSRF